MATLHLDRLPSRDQGRDGDKAIVMDRGVMRLCYKSEGEWYCSFPDVRKVKRDFTESQRIQWVAPRGVFVPATAMAYGMASIEVMRIYDHVFSSVANIDIDTLQKMRVATNSDALVQALGVANVETVRTYDMVLSGVAMALTEQAVAFIVGKEVVSQALAAGIANIERMNVYDIVFSSLGMSALSYESRMKVLRSITALSHGAGIINMERMKVHDAVFVSMANVTPSYEAIMYVKRQVTVIQSSMGLANVELAQIYDIVFTSLGISDAVISASYGRSVGVTVLNDAIGILNTEKIEKLERKGYYDWTVVNYANMAVHENQTRWIQIHDAGNNPLGNRYQVDFGSIMSGAYVESQNTVEIGPLSFVPYVNSFGLYSASTGGTYYLNLAVRLLNDNDGRLTLQENQYIRLAAGNIIVAAS